MKVELVIDLDKSTGCGMLIARKAIEYSELHSDCKPIGYIKAITTKKYKELSFEERVKKLSNE